MKWIINLYGQNWTLAKMLNRTKKRCIACDVVFEPGSIQMYRPLGNPKNRGSRICKKCGEEKGHDLLTEGNENA